MRTLSANSLLAVIAGSLLMQVAAKWDYWPDLSCFPGNKFIFINSQATHVTLCEERMEHAYDNCKKLCILRAASFVKADFKKTFNPSSYNDTEEINPKKVKWFLWSETAGGKHPKVPQEDHDKWMEVARQITDETTEKCGPLISKIPAIKPFDEKRDAENCDKWQPVFQCFEDVIKCDK